VSLILLRAGATVIATTRFPREAALRYAREPDFAQWAHRLRLHRLDLRYAPDVERFAEWLSATAGRLDVLINNAAQTVRRPAAYYDHLLALEAAELPEAARPLLQGDAERSSVPRALAPAPAGPEEIARASELFPPGRLDLDEQQIDLRTVNSWRLRLGEVGTVEAIEVHLVNAIAPFVLTSRLRPLLAADRTDAKHVIHVSAMEASFARRKKTDKHPHTNMAKAALNMMTRTSAADYARDGVWMNSVDTGWITDEDPLQHVERKQRVHDFHPPLDAIDGAARVLDPLFTGLLTGHHPSGLFFKDYRAVDW
jgi:NAD(P)-dependent dehydrogenase (short-subunit alcohol dehydrogenase family)